MTGIRWGSRGLHTYRDTLVSPPLAFQELGPIILQAGPTADEAMLTIGAPLCITTGCTEKAMG